MPDESHVVRSIDWKSTLPFSSIFRGFRIAIHPSKIVLALVALLMIYVGGQVMDAIWPRHSLAVPGEISFYQDTRGRANAAEQFRARRDTEREAVATAGSFYVSRATTAPSTQRELRDLVIKQRDDAVSTADKALADTENSNPTPEQLRRARNTRDATVAEAYQRAAQQWNLADAMGGIGLFSTFADYQINELHRIAMLGRQGQWLGGSGAVDAMIDLLSVAPGWAFRHHAVYFTLFGIYFLIIWAIFGGAISRIAAVQVARDEKISIRQALSFSSAKFLSFVSAPIIPILIIFVVGLVVAVGGLLFNIPFIGPLVGGLLFFLALSAGFVMTLVLLGLLGGFNLMYPTVAVEGSDSFDAISRSFSYLFARPWRLLFYTLVAAVYGTLCYVFIRYFIRLMLFLTWYFVGLGVFTHANSTEPLWPVMWPNPLANPHLAYPVEYPTLNAGQAAGAHLVSFWNHLTISILGAFAISFYFSASTIIYVLMRLEVDATELDDVYLEQTEEEFVETPSVMGSTDAAAPSTPPASSEAVSTEPPLSDTPPESAPPSETPPA